MIVIFAFVFVITLLFYINIRKCNENIVSYNHSLYMIADKLPKFKFFDFYLTLLLVI